MTHVASATGRHSGVLRPLLVEEPSIAAQLLEGERLVQSLFGSCEAPVSERPPVLPAAGAVPARRSLGPPALPQLPPKRLQEREEQKDPSLHVRFYHATYRGKAPDALVFKGGGTKGVVYSGAIRRLEEEGLMKGVSKLAGSSAGSQVAALVAFGYSGKELEEANKRAPWKRLLDYAVFPCGVCRNLRRLFRYYGVCKGAVLEGQLDELFRAKCGRPRCTFQQLFEQHGKELRIGACNVTTRQFEFLDRRSHPDMPVCTAVRASSAIPLVFRPVRWKESLYVDGGLEGNLPVSAFKHGEQVLAFNLISESSKSPPRCPAGFLEFVTAMADMLKESAQALHGVDTITENGCMLSAKGIDVININTGKAGGMDTDMDKKELEELSRRGYEAVHQYLTGEVRLQDRGLEILHESPGQQ